MSSSLKYLYLDHNHLYGIIPDHILNTVNLHKVDLSFNHFNHSSLPIFSSTSLESLSLNSNELYGEIASNVYDTDVYSNLQHFNISDNYFMGNITSLHQNFVSANNAGRSISYDFTVNYFSHCNLTDPLLDNSVCLLNICQQQET